MRYPASEKLEIIRLVEQSHLPVKRTLDKLGIPRATLVPRPVRSKAARNLIPCMKSVLYKIGQRRQSGCLQFPDHRPHQQARR